jgi:hypothetical protein
MVGVAIAALDFAAARTLLDVRPIPLGEWLILGALPVTNILEFGLLVALRRPRSRPFLLGFEIVGALALLLYVFLSTLSGGALLRDFYMEPLIGSFNRTMHARYHPLVAIPVMVSVGVVVMSLPQLVFALLGGFFSSGFRISIARR